MKKLIAVGLIWLMGSGCLSALIGTSLIPIGYISNSISTTTVVTLGPEEFGE